MIIVPPTPEGIARAAKAILNDEIVAYPTETVYGLGVNPFSETAVGRLFDVKQRETANPVLLIIADPKQLSEVASHVSQRAAACIDAFWPGPLSLLLPKAAGIPDCVTAGREKICVRCPSCNIARDLSRAVGYPITSTSANLSGNSPARSISEIDLVGIAIGIDGGLLQPSLPSTVFDPDLNEVVRDGAISPAELERALSQSL